MATKHSASSPEIIATIQIAAAKATTMLRTLGLRLTPEAHDVPLASETQAHLFALVNEAVAAMWDTVDVVPAAATEITGEATDDRMFEVYAELVDGTPKIEILMKLA